MIEIKQSRKLHESGFRFMQIIDNKNNEIINEKADVSHIGLNDWLDGIHIDITKQGIIRIWSNNYELEPIKKFNGSDSVFMMKKKMQGK